MGDYGRVKKTTAQRPHLDRSYLKERAPAEVFGNWICRYCGERFADDFPPRLHLEQRIACARDHAQSGNISAIRTGSLKSKGSIKEEPVA